MGRLGCRPVKDCIIEWGDKRESVEEGCHDALPFALKPCLACCCVSIKFILVEFTSPLLIPWMMLLGVITFCTRLFHCPACQDLLYSAMELCMNCEVDLVDLFFDVGYWRKHHKKGEMGSHQ